jgi:hypothetical protein
MELTVFEDLYSVDDERTNAMKAAFISRRA